MKVLNIHQRTINTSKDQVIDLIKSLSTKNDLVWPTENWPKMKLDKGLMPGSMGGHGPIRYYIEDLNIESFITFRFQKPDGFFGVHRFDIKELAKNKTEIQHTIDMETKGTASIKWLLAIRSLHNALIEDAFDKIENRFNRSQKKSQWNIWVKSLRAILK